MGTGMAAGDDRAPEASQTAISSPLLEDNSIDGATAVLINITAGKGIGMQEIQTASAIVRGAVHDDAEIIFGWVEDDSMGDDLMVTVIATGFGRDDIERGLDPRRATWIGDKNQDPEIPTFIRKGQSEQSPDKARRPTISIIEEDEFEVPAFLRRQAD
jgi:cell division protein FtsZ